MRYLLNSAVITAPGTYTYRLLSREEAAERLKGGDWASRIGYRQTAEHIHSLCGLWPQESREATRMQPGDEALVVRLKYRVQDPTTKGSQEVSDEDWEYGLLVSVE